MADSSKDPSQTRKPGTRPSNVRLSRRTAITGIAALGFTGSRIGAAWAAGAATAFRVHDHGTHTRIVLELTSGPGFQVFQLPDPYRTVIDLPEIDWQLPEGLETQGAGLVRDLRYGLFQPGQSRVVLDLGEPANVDRAFMLAPTASTPWRLVIDLKASSRASFLGKAGPAKAIKVAQSDPSIFDLEPEVPLGSDVVTASRDDIPFPERKPAVRPSERKPVIAIDAGHGGVDPGAIGVSGTREKDVSLAAARQLKATLEGSGRYKVVMTRNRDISLRLRQRIDIARRAAADAFISLHADSLGRSDVRGASVYTLSENASDKEAATLAAKENKADLIIGMDLTQESSEVRNILIDLAQRESMNLGAHLATGLIEELRKEIKLLRNTHRFAGFAVLKAPDVPSILFEMGYLSNREDERALRQSGYRQKLANALLRAFDRYFADVPFDRRT